MALVRRGAPNQRAMLDAVVKQARDDDKPAGRPLSREDRAVWALRYLDANADISPCVYARALGVDRKTARTDLGALVARGLVAVSGATTSRRYTLRRDEARTG